MHTREIPKKRSPAGARGTFRQRGGEQRARSLRRDATGQGLKFTE